MLAAAMCVSCASGARPVARAGCPRGDVLVSGQAHAEALRGCTRIDGDLTVRTGAAIDLDGLAALEDVTGSVVIGPSIGLDTLDDFGRLRAIGGTLRLVANGDITAAFFPALERAGAVAVDSNLAMTQAMFPALREVAGGLTVRDNGALELIDLTRLARVGATLAVENNRILADIWLGAARADAVQVAGNPALDSETHGRLLATAAPHPGS